MFLSCTWGLMPIIFKLTRSSARMATCTLFLIYVVVCMNVGYLNWTSFWTLMMQLAAAVSASLLCHWNEKNAKEDFARSIAIRFASQTNQNLLHTLIPPDVLKKFNFDQHNISDAQAIPMCTIMFCMFDYEAMTRDDFDFIEVLIASLDEAVEKSGMKSSKVNKAGSPTNPNTDRNVLFL